MSVQEWDSITCDECGSYNCSPVICEDCVKKKIEKMRSHKK